MSDEPQFDAGEQHSVEVREKRIKGQQRERDIALGKLLEVRGGRALAWWMLEQCRIYQTTFAPGQADVSAFQEGMRNVGLQFLAQIMRIAPEALPLMQIEASEASRAQ